MSTSFDFASWPPELSDDQLHELTLLATSYALSHSLLYLPVCSLPPPAPTSAIHAPLSLLPAPFPRALFEKVRKLQRVYSVLYTRIALDTEFLDEVMGVGGGVADVDPFTRHLWLLWKEYRDGGLPEVRERALLFLEKLMLCSSPLTLGFFARTTFCITLLDRKGL